MIINKQAKKILNKCNSEYSLFGNDYYINIYRGCTHGCIYCDSRSSCYGVEKFDTDIIVKENATSLLYNELKSKKERSVIGISGSMSDCYMPIEKSLKLSRECLKIIDNLGFATQVHTKSDLVLRDLDLLKSINRKSNANVLFTITTIDDVLSKKIEPNAPASSKRFDAIKKLSNEGITTGIAIWPVLPFITDNVENIRQLIHAAYRSGAEYVLFSPGVTLRDNQRTYFLDRLSSIDKDLKNLYIREYGNRYDCLSNNRNRLNQAYKKTCKDLNLKTYTPHFKFKKPTQLSLF